MMQHKQEKQKDYFAQNINFNLSLTSPYIILLCDRVHTETDLNTNLVLKIHF